MISKIRGVLDQNNIQYELVYHKNLGEVRSAEDFIHLKGINEKQVAKTIFVKDKKSGVFGFGVLPALGKLDFKALASALGYTSVEFASQEDLKNVTGYERYGTSPIGVDLPVVIDITTANQDVIYLGTGEAGEELEIKPSDLMYITKAKVAVIENKSLYDERDDAE